jgi:hypothetical protein
VQAKATVDIVEVDGRPIAAAFQVSCAGVICVGISAWFAILFRFHFVGFNSLQFAPCDCPCNAAHSIATPTLPRRQPSACPTSTSAKKLTL